MLPLNGKMLLTIKKYLTFFLFPLLIYETGNLENHSGSTRQNLSSLPTETIAVTDTFIHPETYDSKISDTSHSATYSKLNFHSLRHTFASWLVQKGGSIYTVSKLLYRTDIKTTQIYAHLRRDDLKATTDLLI